MRKDFVSALDSLVDNEKFIFLSGDLGFMALESLKERLGPRFINAGVAEQNMLSVAAGLASKGFIPWVYSIAPFATLRPFEQIRNDICLHNLPVKIVGNGGGFGYGIMGSTHHALEDVGAMRLLPNMSVSVPVFRSDVKEAVTQMNAATGPGYLRLNLEVAETPERETFQCWRTLSRGTKAVVITMGTVVGNVLNELKQVPAGEWEIVSVGKFPLEPLPASLVQKIQQAGRLMTIEEHVGAGGLGEAIAKVVLQQIGKPIQFLPLSAVGYPSGKYGSQRWHLEECGLAGPALRARLLDFIGNCRV